MGRYSRGGSWRNPIMRCPKAGHNSTTTKEESEIWCPITAKRVSESPNHDHIVAVFGYQLVMRPRTTAYQNKTRATFKRGSGGVSDVADLQCKCVCCVTAWVRRSGVENEGRLAAAAPAKSGALRIGRGCSNRSPFNIAIRLYRARRGTSDAGQAKSRQLGRTSERQHDRDRCRQSQRDLSVDCLRHVRRPR